MIEPAAGAVPTVQGEAVSIGPAVEADSVIWTARLRTGRVVIFRASGSRAFRAAALIALVAVEVDLVATASVAAGDLAAVALAALVVEDSAGFAVAGDDENKAWNVPILFLINSHLTKILKERA
jgi:hypothetical protein